METGKKRILKKIPGAGISNLNTRINKSNKRKLFKNTQKKTFFLEEIDEKEKKKEYSSEKVFFLFFRTALKKFFFTF